MLRRPGPAVDVPVPLSGFRMELIAQVIASRPPPLEADPRLRDRRPGTPPGARPHSKLSCCGAAWAGSWPDPPGGLGRPGEPGRPGASGRGIGPMLRLAPSERAPAGVAAPTP